MRLCQACGSVHVDSGADVCPRCSGALVEVAPEHLVEGRYAILEGPAEASSSRRARALDVLHERWVELQLFASGDPALVAEASAKAAALAKVHHDHVIETYGFGEHRGASYLALEHVRGATLARILEDHRARGVTIPPTRAATILRSVASAVAALHDAGVVHGSLGPHSVVIEERTGRPVLVDLALLDGASRPADPGAVRSLAPEECTGATATQSSDVYALGRLGCELFTGRPPFDELAVEDPAGHPRREPPPFSEIVPGASAFDGPCRRALAERPDDRYRDAGALLRALDAAESSPPPPRVTSSPPDPESAPGASVYVLVVDDDPVFRRMATRAAQLAFYRRPVRVKMVESGEAALEVAARRTPELILLDHSLPGMTGVDTLTALRARERGTPSRVIVVSAALGNVERWRFAVLGVTDFIGKPVGLTDLTSALTEITATTWFAHLPELDASSSSSSTPTSPRR